MLRNDRKGKHQSHASRYAGYSHRSGPDARRLRGGPRSTARARPAEQAEADERQDKIDRDNVAALAVLDGMSDGTIMTCLEALTSGWDFDALPATAEEQLKVILENASPTSTLEKLRERSDDERNSPYPCIDCATRSR